MAKPSNLRIEDVGAATARADLNDILISLASLQTTDGAGTGYTGEPTTTYPNMLWYDKATDILKMRSEADDAWINLGTLDQVANTFAANVALASQAQAEAGTDNTTVMTPLRTAQAMLNATAGASFGAVGTYAFAFVTNTGVTNGTTYSGSALTAGGIRGDSGGSGALSDGFEQAGFTTGGTALSGTWRAMGRSNNASGNSIGRMTLFLRIS